MSNPFLGEIRIVGFNFAPVGWALCNGQLLPISQNTALFSLLGTYYGGDGKTTFALPNLQSRVPLHAGQGPGLPAYVQGQFGGSPTATLQIAHLPSHNHYLNCVGIGGNVASPVGAFPAVESTGTSLDYSTASATGQMSPAAIAPTGSGQPLSVEPPYLCLNFIIALQGIFPSRT
jgi:microcystin-dependent protein